MRKAIGWLLVVVGLGWSGVGLYACQYAVGPHIGVEGEETRVGFGIMFASAFFVLPGLVVAGIGAIAAGKS